MHTDFLLQACIWQPCGLYCESITNTQYESSLAGILLVLQYNFMIMYRYLVPCKYLFDTCAKQSPCTDNNHNYFSYCINYTQGRQEDWGDPGQIQKVWPILLIVWKGLGACPQEILRLFLLGLNCILGASEVPFCACIRKCIPLLAVLEYAGP